MERASLLPRSSVCVKSSLTVITTFVCDTHDSFAYLEHAFSFGRLPPPPPHRQLIFWLCTSPASHNWINARENVLTYRTLGKTRGILYRVIQTDQKYIHFSDISIFLRGRFFKIGDLFFFFLFKSDSEVLLMQWFFNNNFKFKFLQKDCS